MGDADKEDHLLYLVSEHEVLVFMVWEDPRIYINPGKAFYWCHEVQVRYIQYRGLELGIFKMHQSKHEVRYGARCSAFKDLIYMKNRESGRHSQYRSGLYHDKI